MPAALQVQKADDCIGEEVKQKTQALKNGEVAQILCVDLAATSKASHRQVSVCSNLQVLVLENVRFYKEETKNDPGFAEKVQHYSGTHLLSLALAPELAYFGCCN